MFLPPPTALTPKMAARYDSILCPISLKDYMGPLHWTPTPTDDDGTLNLGEISKTIGYYNWDLMSHATLSPEDMQDITIVGCRGGSPRAIDIAWQEPTADGRGGAARAFRECVLTDALSLADLVSIFASAYYRNGNRPPPGMTLRWILTDPMRREVRLEFKSYLQLIAEQRAADADADADGVATVSPKKRIGPGSDGDALARASARWNAEKRLRAANTAEVLWAADGDADADV